MRARLAQSVRSEVKLVDVSISFAQAVADVRTLRERDWRATVGTPFVSSEGYADAADYLIVWGCREYLVGGDATYALLSNTVTFVSRSSGVIRDEQMTENLDKIDAMRPVRLTT